MPHCGCNRSGCAGSCEVAKVDPCDNGFFGGDIIGDIISPFCGFAGTGPSDNRDLTFCGWLAHSERSLNNEGPFTGDYKKQCKKERKRCKCKKEKKCSC